MPLLSRLAVQAARAYGMLVSGATTNVPASYLVVAGGGGGGGQGGGGGAGGYLTSTATLSTLNTYSITVGAGGNGGSSSSSGNVGSNSSISGTGLTTITSFGGGFGGRNDLNGGNGGSGGGGGAGGSAVSGGTGTSGQGFAGGGTPGFAGGGGGGGASAVGQTTTSNTGGNGGAGTASSISGTSVTYAGGGGGGGANGTVSGGTGGTGGGGNGGNSTSGAGAVGTAGTANRGGGGGGGGGWVTSAAGSAGGSGIVIISYTSATPKFVGGTITTSGGNQIHTFTSSGTLSPITPITASYLVVAGGAGAGRTLGGGGGAGGLLTSSTTLYSGATYVVTVGAGGAAGATFGTKGTSGGNSVISGTGLTTITSTGGGGGGADGSGTVAERSGNSGGSGGGAVNVNGVPGAGTSGQGNAGGSGSTNSSGGGGGAGAVGGNGSGNIGGTGGNGLSSSISGTSTFYAGGGGGGGYLTASTNAGGLGGGGNGTNDATNATAGTTNTGGGGGAAGFTGAPAGTSAAGGSGIVIISYAGSQQFNGGLVTSSGGNTIHTFTSTGALTPLTNNLTNSLRFRSSASAYLSRTPTVAGSRTTWTWSAWIKRGVIDGASKMLFTAGADVNNNTHFYFNGNSLGIFSNTSGTTQADYATPAVFRDPSAWYHVVAVFDTTQSTAGNRFRLYVNGNMQTLTTVTQVSQNVNGHINNSVAHNISRSDFYGNLYFDGYMTDINFIDGQALEPYYFGNNDANGVWKPIQYRGTYGINGFYLNFSNTTSTTTLGFDSSPNGNNWTCNNISLTAGTTYDAMTDVPTNTSATVANYAVVSPIDVSSVGATISNGNLRFNNGSAGSQSTARATIGVSSGKWYWETTCTTFGGSNPDTGILGTNSSLSSADQYVGNYALGYSYGGNGQKRNNNSGSAYGASYTSGDVIGVALDMDAGTLTFYKNNTSQGTAFTGLSGLFSPAISGYNGVIWDANFGQRPFTYTPPTGFVALNTFNLPTPTILQGNKYMDATLYTGNGVSNTIVNQGQFKPDLVWVKSRSSVQGHGLYNPLMSGYILDTSSTAAQQATAAITNNANGWTMPDAVYNNNAVSYVGWQWQAGQGSTSSNTSGSITSTVSVNTTAGFSVVTYAGNSTSSATVGHGLGVSPSMVIIKNRSSVTNWVVRHSSLSSTQNVSLNTTDAAYTVSSGTANGGVGAFTSTTFGFISGTTGLLASNQTSNNYVAYCWAEIAGFSKFGSYTGNGSADGPFIFTGFRPKFIMWKRSSGIANWVILDTSRNTFNLASSRLFPSLSNAETSATDQMDILSNGFKIRVSGATDVGTNGSGDTYIYMAFAENPFKNANAR